MSRGGTLRHDAPSYVERQADRDLQEGLLGGEFCYVLTSRQMGKSSLMVRAVNQLRERGLTGVALDLTAIGQNLSPEQWYDGLLTLLARQVDLEDRLERFWMEHSRLGPVQRFFTAIREVVLEQLPHPGASHPQGMRLVIFVDEIDSVRSLPFSTDEFFAAIRECYNRRTEDAAFNRVTFCLLGVATPSELIRDTRTTPFNVGRRIEVCDFSFAEAAPLGKGLSDDASRAELILNRIFYWTNGHPYLTQRMCQAVADRQGKCTLGVLENEITEAVDQICKELFDSNRARDRDDNLLFVRERIVRTELDLAGVLRLYDQIRRRQPVPDDERNPLLEVLRLSGITGVRDGFLTVRNRIYTLVFDSDWVSGNMPKSQKPSKSIAVLPFINLSAEVDNEYLSDGLTEELINALGQLPGLRVASRTSAFQFKNGAEDLRKIATLLNVEIVLAGSVRKSGDRIRISAELVNVADGSRLWSQIYHYKAGDLFTIQDEIAGAIVDQLKAHLGYESGVAAIKHYTQNLEAYNLYLKGRYYWNKRNRESLKKGISCFEQAIQKDPGYALAYAGLADAYNLLGTYNYLPPLEAYPKAKAAASRALELDETLAQAHSALGCARSIYDWNWLGAEDEFKRAIVLNPSYATARQWYAVNCLTPLGRHEESIVQLRQAQNVDPLSISINASVGLALYFARQYPEAIVQYRQTIEMDSSFWLTHLFVGWAYVEEGMVQEAILAFQQAIKLGDGDPVGFTALAHAFALQRRREESLQVLVELSALANYRHVPAYEVAVVHFALGDKEETLRLLNRAMQERSFRLIYLNQDPRLKALRSDEKFMNLVRHMGLE